MIDPNAQGEKISKFIDNNSSLDTGIRPKSSMALFNLFFICFYQMGLIFLFTLPILAAWQGASIPLFWGDYLIAFFMFLFIVLVTISDLQQYEFQTEKYRLIGEEKKLDGDYKLGFRTTGLLSISRHPNFACEQAIWVMFYLFSVSATGQWINWSIMGCLLLIVLFYNSARLFCHSIR